MLRFLDDELRAVDTEANDMIVEGYALKFDSVTQIGPDKYGWNETISRAALNNAKLDDVVLTLNHSMDNVLAGTRNGSLELSTDDIGLKIKAKIIDTQLGRDVYKLIQSRLINKMSYKAAVNGSDWTYARNGIGKDLRVVTSIKRLIDVSAVTYPAYEETLIVARSGEFAAREHEIHLRQLEKINHILGGNQHGF